MSEALYNLIFISLWLLSALLDSLESVYLWQLKEYRLDRFKDFLTTRQGKKFLLSYKTLWRLPVFILLLLTPLIPSTGLIIFFLIILSLDLVNNLFKIIIRTWRRPKLTIKTALLVLSSLIFEVIILYYALSLHPLLIILASCRFILTGLTVYGLNFFSNFIKKWRCRQAASKISRYKKLTVIGVTGSYGKTTVKNFLAQMLSEKYRVTATPKNINTEIGIAKLILKTDFSGTEIFVVEMAAYRIGEIKLICDMVKPKIGILTAISEQHLQLFGSLKNTQTAKYELLRSLPPDGLAITNSDNDFCREFLGELKCQVKTFGRMEEYSPDCLVANIESGLSGHKFSAVVKNKNLTETYNIETRIVGAHNATNIAPLILVAQHLDMAKQDVIELTDKLKLPEATLEMINCDQSLVIDDSYNCNPEGFKAALDFIQSYTIKGEKIVVTRGMLELGFKSDELHEKIGRRIAEVADKLIIISPDFEAPLRRGAGGGKLIIKSIFKTKELVDFFSQAIKQTDIILIENRAPDDTMKIIKSNRLN
jgi:UDP-N-acetylmuramoyl-tripeptide--D-alanyl-D-alanine ligase